jgi:hypothetical protein
MIVDARDAALREGWDRRLRRWLGRHGRAKRVSYHGRELETDPGVPPIPSGQKRGPRPAPRILLKRR